jgi:predicted methyltransferase
VSSVAAEAIAPQLMDVLTLPYRSAENTARDPYRNPAATLTFFGIKPNQSVLEIWPARGWYTEILAPYLKNEGQLTIAHFRIDTAIDDERKKFWSKLAHRLQQDIAEHKAHFGDVKAMAFDPPQLMLPVDAGPFDMILSFRNAHIWNEEGHLNKVLSNFYQVLKPGGTLGLVEHRASRLSDISSSAAEGYLDESYVIKAAEQAGFTLIERSEINANPRDSKDHPKGVYALPPTLAMGQKDRERYLAIGESDRMTLRFRKIEKP